MEPNPVLESRGAIRLSRIGAVLFALGSGVVAYYCWVDVADKWSGSGPPLLKALVSLALAILSVTFFAWAAWTGYRWEFDGEVPNADD